jgi:hypothetical protein
MTNYNTGQNDPATQDDWPEPATHWDPWSQYGNDQDPRKFVTRELTDWLAVHVTGVDLRVLHEAAVAALDRVEDAMSENGGDWSTPW